MSCQVGEVMVSCEGPLMEQRHHELGVDRAAYRDLPRHTVRLVTWNHKDPNVAGVLRSAEAFRIEHVYMLRKPRLKGPLAGEGRLQPVTFTPDLVGAIAQARADGYTVLALEQTTASIPLVTARLPARLCLVAGDEGDGVPPKALALCDGAVEIPQYGLVPSLNVASAISIALYEWVRQHAAPPGRT
jgi:tRNA G18 (ribose-2'-O)-methylase SpoU